MSLCFPIFPISRTLEPGNNMCVTSKRYNYTLSNKTVTKIVGGITQSYRVPCILVPYIDELQTYLNTMNIRSAIRITLYNHNIIIDIPTNNKRRYIYSHSPFVPIDRTLPIFYKKTFILNLSNNEINDLAIDGANEYIQNILAEGTNTNNSLFYYNQAIFSPVTEDAAYISVVADDNKSFVSKVSDVKNTYFGKNIMLVNNQPFIDGYFNIKYKPITAICNSVSTNGLFIQFGIIIIDQLSSDTDISDNKFIFIPFVFNALASLYTHYRLPDRVVADQSVTFTYVPNFIPYVSDYATKLIPNITF